MHRSIVCSAAFTRTIRNRIVATRPANAASAPSPAAAGREQIPGIGRITSIAVLPFTSLSTMQNQVLADGLTDEVTANSQNRRPSRHLTDLGDDVQADEQGCQHDRARAKVRYFLEGSVRRAGDRLRITGQLIDATTDDHLWADKYDGSIADVFAIQERLARLTVGRLAVPAHRRRRPAAGRPAHRECARLRMLSPGAPGSLALAGGPFHAIQLLRRARIVGENAVLYRRWATRIFNTGSRHRPQRAPAR